MGRAKIHIAKPGEVYGRWTVVSESDRMTRNGCRNHVYCKCKCGTERVVSARELCLGKSKSCGCWKRERSTKHGWTGRDASKVQKDLYNRWKNMVQRCYQETNQAYANYGGRGVRVCAAWRDSPDGFIADMQESFETQAATGERVVLDRIDVNGHYSPDNCRWTTYSESNRNRRPHGSIPYPGVSEDRKGYRASISLGCYPTPEAANEARQEALERLSDLL